MANMQDQEGQGGLHSSVPIVRVSTANKFNFNFHIKPGYLQLIRTQLFLLLPCQ
jgi:hypothetical protein